MPARRRCIDVGSMPIGVVNPNRLGLEIPVTKLFRKGLTVTVWNVTFFLITTMVAIAGAKRQAYARISPVMSVFIAVFVGFGMGSFWSSSEISNHISAELLNFSWMAPDILSDISALLIAAKPADLLMPALSLALAHWVVFIAFDIPAVLADER